MSYAENRRRLDDAVKAARPMQAPPPRLGLVTQDFLDSVAPQPRAPLRLQPPLPVGDGLQRAQDAFELGLREEDAHNLATRRAALTRARRRMGGGLGVLAGPAADALADPRVSGRILDRAIDAGVALGDWINENVRDPINAAARDPIGAAGDVLDLVRRAPPALGRVARTIQREAPGAVVAARDALGVDSDADIMAQIGDAAIRLAPVLVNEMTRAPFEREEQDRYDLDYATAMGDEEGAERAADSVAANAALATANVAAAPIDIPMALRGLSAVSPIRLGRGAADADPLASVRAPPMRDLTPQPNSPPPGVTEAYHGTDQGRYIREFNPNSHFGTERAARDRLDAIGAKRSEREVIPVRIAAGEMLPFEDVGMQHSARGIAARLEREGQLTPEEVSYIVEPFDVARANRAPGEALHVEGMDPSYWAEKRLGEVLSRRGVSALRYTNQVEDAGSTSYVVPDPRNVQRADLVRTRGLFSGPRYEFRGEPPAPAGSYYGPLEFDRWRLRRYQQFGPPRDPVRDVTPPQALGLPEPARTQRSAPLDLSEPARMGREKDPDGAFVRTGEITSPFEIDAALAARRPGPINFGEALNPQTGAVNRVEPIGPTLGAARDEARIVEGWMRDAQPGPPTLHITDAVSSDPDAARRSVFRRLADALPVSDLRGQVNMFVGPRARPTPRTSGFVGPDGKRRYEISDEGMAWLPGGLERARRVWSGPPGGSARLDEIIRHDALFEAYPWMRAIRVGGDNLGGELGHVRHGALSARGDRINLDFGKHQTPEQRLEALQHEIQHIVQHHERFAPGGRPTPEQTAERGFFDAYSGIAGEAEAIDTTARRKLSLDERELLRPVLASGGDFEVRAPYAYPLGDAVRLGAGMGGGALAGGLAGAALSGQEAEASSLDGEGFDLSNVVMPVLGAVAGVAGAAGARSIARMGVGPVSRGTRRGAEAGAPVIPDDPSQWRDLMGRHPWINSPSRAQLIIMANARNANGAARYSLADIANATGYGEGSIPVALSQARRAGVPLESRPMGRAASGPPGGDLLNRFLDAAERRMRAGQAVRVREIAEQIGVKPESLSSMVSIARRAADGGDTNWRIPDSILTRIRAIPRTQTKSDRLASIAIPALAAGGLGALVLGGDEAEAQGLGPGFGPMPEGIDVREGRWVGERYPVTLPDGTEAFEQDLALPDGRRLRIVRSQSADGSVTVHGAYPARVVDPRDEIYESGDNYRLPYSAAVEEVEKPGWLAPAMSALPVLALFGGRVGPHITGRWGRFNPRQASAVGGAAFAGAGGAAIGAATEDEDMLDLTGLGAISGGAIGVAPRAGVDLLDNVRRTMPPIRLRVPRAKVRAQDLVPTRPPGAPSERVMDLDEAVIEAEFDLMRREGRRTLRATPAQRRLKRGSDMSLEERAAIPDGDRGSLSNRIGALNADQLRNLARELGLDTTGTKRALAARIASAAREGGEGVYARIRHLYPYL